MLHKDLLRRLCEARDLLRGAEAGERSVESVAEQVGFSTYHFIRLYKAVFGETPKQAQIDARLEYARRMLILTDRSVTQIAFDVGYASLGTFSHQFTNRVGRAPSDFRTWARSQRSTPGRLPDALAPGCFSLMGAEVV